MLLGSRGRARSRSGSSRGGFGKKLNAFVDSVLGRRREERAPRGPLVSGWIALGAVLVAFGGGYLVGGGGRTIEAAGKDALRAKTEVQAPGFVNEAAPPKLAAQGFVVAAYTNLAEDEARLRANELAKYLQGKQLGKARPFLRQSERIGRAWGVVVYFDGEAEQGVTRERLLQLGEVPDANFTYLRNAKQGWPIAMPID